MYVKLNRTGLLIKRYNLRLVGENSKIRMSSETYFDKWTARRAGRQLAADLKIEYRENQE